MKTHERNDAVLRIPDQTRTRAIDKSGSFLLDRRVASLMAIAGVNSLLLGLDALPTTAQAMIQEEDASDPTPTPEPNGMWVQTPNASLTEPQLTLVAVAQTEATLIPSTPTFNRPTTTPTATQRSERATPTSTYTPENITPTPTETIFQLTVHNQRINIRPTPNTQEQAITSFPTGSILVGLAQEHGQSINGNNVWYQVELPDGRIGWVWSGGVAVETRTPTLTASATPTSHFVTPTPSNTPTFEAITPTVTPTAYETAVTMTPLDSNRFITTGQLDRYPPVIRYTNWLYEQEVSFRVDSDQLPRLMTVNGTPLPFGVYDEAHPLPIDPRAFEGFQEFRGGDLRPVYIVGILTEIEGWQDRNPSPMTSYANPEFTVAIPLPDGTYFPVIIRMATTGGRYVAIDNSGNMVQLPTQLLDDYNRIPYQRNGVDHITYSRQGRWVTFPTSQGTSIIRVGDPIIVRVITNLDVYNDTFRNGFILSSSGRLPEQVIADLYDGNPENNGDWYQTSSAVAVPFSPMDESPIAGR